MDRLTKIEIQEIEMMIIQKANDYASGNFMVFPDWDETQKMGTLPEALTVLLFDMMEDIPNEKAYDFFVAKIGDDRSEFSLRKYALQKAASIAALFKK